MLLMASYDSGRDGGVCRFLQGQRAFSSSYVGSDMGARFAQCLRMRGVCIGN